MYSAYHQGHGPYGAVADAYSPATSMPPLALATAFAVRTPTALCPRMARSGTSVCTPTGMHGGLNS